MVIPESLAIRLANSTEITAENFFKNIFRSYQSLQNNEKFIQTINETTIASPIANTTTPITTTMVIPKVINELLNTTTTTTPSTTLNQDITIGPSSMMLKNHQDDDDDTEGDIDYEASGNKQINWNDTTIQLDGDKSNL